MAAPARRRRSDRPGIVFRINLSEITAYCLPTGGLIKVEAATARKDTEVKRRRSFGRPAILLRGELRRKRSRSLFHSSRFLRAASSEREYPSVGNKVCPLKASALSAFDSH